MANQSLHPTTTPLSDAFAKLPFAVFRQVVDYVGLLPRLGETIHRPLTEHFRTYYCRRCGEYITARKSMRSKRRGPYHLSCRERWYTPPRKRLKNYHVGYISLSQLVWEQPRHWFHHQISCPAVFYSRQPKNCYRIHIPNTLTHVRLVHCPNALTSDFRYNSDFSLIPDMYLPELQLFLLTPTLLDRRLQQILVGTPRTEFMERYHPSSLQSAFEWMVHLKPDAFRWVEPYMYQWMRPFLYHADAWIQDRLVTEIGVRRIMFYNPQWFRDILIDRPEVLNELTERDIRRFFRKNVKWFCEYVKCQPRALHYVTLIHPPKDKDDDQQSDEPDGDRPRKIRMR